MKIEISPIKIVPGATTIWHEALPGVDIIMDPKNLTFAPGSIEEIYTFHVLDHLFPNEIAQTISNWKKVLKRGCNLYIVVDDFEYIARSFIGGDFDIDIFNARYSHPMNFRRESLIEYLSKAGFIPDNMRIWMDHVTGLFNREDHELIIAAQKHD